MGRGALRALGLAAAAAAVVAALGAVLTYGLLLAPAQRRLAHERDLLEASRRELARTVELLGSDGLRQIELFGTGAASDAGARLFWSGSGEGGYLIARRLAPLPTGHRYVLWLVGSARRAAAAGALEPDARGAATLSFELPSGSGGITRAFVTEEAGAPGKEPRGVVLLAAASASPGS